MNCTIAKRLISAYYDKELAPGVQSELKRHLAKCTQCAQILAGFQELSCLAKRLPGLAPPGGLWNRIKGAFGQPKTNVLLRVVGPFLAPARTTWQTHPAARVAAILVVAVVIVAGGLLVESLGVRYEEHRQVAADFDRYLRQFRQDADSAQRILMDNYHGRRVDVRDAATIVRYGPVAAKSPPKGYTLGNVHLLKMPCCTCVQVIWRRQASCHLAILEHADEQVIWFGDRPSIAVRCHGKALRIVQIERGLAATWTSGERQLTLIGANDVDELLRLVLHFENAS